MRKIYFIEAVREALDYKLQQDKNVFLIGEDIGIYGGAFGVTRGLFEKYGEDRLMETPIAESSMIGLVVGSAMSGMRPVAEIMYMDFITLAFDQILNHAAKFHYIYDGQIKVPMVIRTPSGAGRGYGATHSQSLENLFLGVPGLKIVCPSSPYDAKGLLISSIEDNNPVIFIENKTLYGSKGEVPEEDYRIELGKANILQQGHDLTIISYGKGMMFAKEVVSEYDSLSVELIDLRTIKPLDFPTILKSVRKTNRVIIIEESVMSGGISAEISAQINEFAYQYLDAPIIRIGNLDCPIPCSPHLENEIIINKKKIKDGIEKIKQYV